MSNKEKAQVNIIGPASSWFEGKALEQLARVSALEGMRHVVGQPDMHAGKDSPNGAIFVSEAVAYPHLVGNDIGCGYGLFRTDLKARKLKVDRFVRSIADLGQAWDGDMAHWLKDHHLPSSDHDARMGTIGAGNHFAELQVVDEIYGSDIIDELDVDQASVLILVHSGSRSLGQSILRQHAAEMGAKPVGIDTSTFREYSVQHDTAMRWARANRALIAQRFAHQLRADSERLLDLPHNCIEQIDGGQVVHRKGATSTGNDYVVIPGSRGAYTFLVKLLTHDISHGWSVAHGAGRRWDRHSTEKRLRERFRKESLVQTRLGGRVICEDKALLFQEAPEAYKDIEKVIQILVEAEIIKVVAKLRPVVTYKKKGPR